MLHPFDCSAVGGGIAAAAGNAGIADGTVGLNGETHGNFAVGAACVLEEAHFGSSRLSGKEAGNQQSGGQNIFMFITFSRLLNELSLLESAETVVPRCFDGRIMSMSDIFLQTQICQKLFTNRQFFRRTAHFTFFQIGNLGRNCHFTAPFRRRLILTERKFYFENISFIKFQFHPPRKCRAEITLTNIYRQAAKNSDIRYYLAAISENLCCFMATKRRYLVFIFDKRYKFTGQMLPAG